MGLVLTFGAIAQLSNNDGHNPPPQRKTVTFAASDIQYWVGTGSNSAVVIIGWDDNPNGDFALAWGVHWNGSCTAVNMLDTIATYDSRVAYAISSDFVTSIGYNDGTLVSGSDYSYWCYTINGDWAGAYGSQPMADGDVMEISSSCYFSLSTAVAATDPNGGSSTPDPLPDTVDASLPFSEILFWVGTGTDSAEFIVNFAQPDTAFAWGYLFNGSTTAQAMVNAIAAADPRFWVDGDPSTSGDLHFLTDNGDTLGLSPVDPNVGYNFWWTNLNGVSAGAGAATTLHNGDVFKYGDFNSATGWDFAWGYYMEEAWNTIPTPVSEPVIDTTPAVVEATIDFADILYWVGTGTNEAALAVNWADTALAWGYRWDGTATVGDMLNDISTADPRLSTVSGAYGIDDILFVENGDTLHKAEYSWWGSTNNGMMDMGIYQTLNNGDFEKWADGTTGVQVDSNWVEDWGGYWNYIYVYPMTIYPVSVPVIDTTPAVVEATIDFDNILYWVGTGTNEAALAVNWADTALAWGYRWDGTKTVTDMMNDIAAADPRFSYTINSGYLDDIIFIESEGDTLRKGLYSWWESKNNGLSDMGMGQTLANGDLEKWAEPAAGVIVDSVDYGEWGVFYTYAYPMTIYPVSVPDTTTPIDTTIVEPLPGQFCGAVGTEGCNAIAANDSTIVAWATACTLNLGPQNISVEGSPLVSYHTAQDAVGPCTMNNNLDVVSLGDGGSATLTFAHPIRNGEGPDFAVFENSFNDNFLELAFVEVSTDGEHFVRFPATSLTPTNTQVTSSIDPTNINNLAGKFRMGYGTPFDLAELADSSNINIDSIVYVRIVDVVGSINPLYATYDSYGHIVNDPWPTDSYSSGFDLDGVAVIYELIDSSAIDTTVVENPVEATIDFADILYWVGTGTNEAVLAVNWADTALAWGYRWNGAKTVTDMMNDIAADDPRFSYTMDGGYLGDILFVENGDTLSKGQNSWWESKNNGISDMGMSQPLANGDLEKWAEPAAGVIVDSMEYDGWWYYSYVHPMTIHPVSVPVNDTTPVIPLPEEATIDFADILYWVGTGTNEAVLAVNWADTALAWGYRWNGTKTVTDMMNDIAAADPRFSYTGNGYIDDIFFSENGITLSKPANSYWESKNNGYTDMGMGQTLSNGDFEKWATPAAGIVTDSMMWESVWYYMYTYPMEIHPVSEPTTSPEDATIAASDIHYWIGQGQNQIIFVVNWASKAYAWGYRFATDSVSLAAIMDDIAAADSRFSYTGTGLVSDILYNDGNESLSITPGNYWSHLLNGYLSAGMASYLHNGDFSRWADPAAGVLVDSIYIPEWDWTDYIYVYPQTIIPVEEPQVAGPFCGIVGSEGCNAIAADSSAIVAWATACTVVRGPQDVSVSGSPAVSYGTESSAIGACNLTDNLSVVSLGDGGSATLTFAQPIADGPGPDFAVFENSFGDYFLELAFVEVSSDGQHFVRFPATSLTQTDVQVGGSGSLDPTYINNLAGKFRMGYGTPFDLNELRDSTGININAITHVRVVDVVGSINPQYGSYDAFGHLVNDPWPTNNDKGGFDLDGVAVLNVATTEDIADVTATTISVYPNPTTDLLQISTNSTAQAELYDLSGRMAATYKLTEGVNTLSIGNLPAGVYMLRAAGTVQKIVKY